MLLIVLFFFTLNSWSQTKFKISTNCKELNIPDYGDHKVHIDITNSSDYSFVLLSEAPLIDREIANTYQLGMTYKLLKAKSSLSCRPSLNYVLDPTIPKVEIKPGETKSIQVIFFRECFRKKGKYEIEFFLSVSEMQENKLAYKTYSSNKIIIRIR